MPFAAVALTAYVPHNFPHDKLEPGLNENAFYDPSNFTYPAGTYICEVEVDTATGAVKIDRMTACDDFGNVINPMIVEGQVHGGLAQGLGQALLEHGVYDNETGQLLSRQLHGLRDAARRRLARASPSRPSRARPARTIRWASRAAARPAPSARRRR